MKANAIIWGTGQEAKQTFFQLKEFYNILFFVDSDVEKQGTYFCGMRINPPEELLNYTETKVFIATSRYYREIKELCRNMKVQDVDYFGPNTVWVQSNELLEELNQKRSIDMGKMLIDNDNKLGGVKLKELTYVLYGSGVLDYALLYILAKKYGLKKYLEIGTYIGESINILTDLCDRCYSITAPLDAPYSMKGLCQVTNMPNYSDRLIKSPKITQFHENSHTFDFHRIERDIDLYFIDAEHSYNGVYLDTKHVF